MVSKIIYKQQFVAAVQKKSKYTTKANSNNSESNSSRNSYGNSQYKKYKNRCQCHTIRSGPNAKIDKPPSQVTHCTSVGKQPEGLGGGVEGKIIARPQRRRHQGGPPHLIQGDKGGGRGCSLRTPRSRPEVHCRAWARDWIRAVVGMASTEA